MAVANYYPPLYGSAIIEGQLVPVLQSQAFTPGNAVGPQYVGNGANPATIPMGIAGDPSQTAAAAANAPFNLRGSPVLWMVGMLAVGFFLLRFVHWA